MNVKYVLVPDSRARPPYNSDIFLSSLLFKGGSFLSLELLVLDPFERIGKIYLQNALTYASWRIWSRNRCYNTETIIRPSVDAWLPEGERTEVVSDPQMGGLGLP
jgi:hypothetical protein